MAWVLGSQNYFGLEISSCWDELLDVDIARIHSPFVLIQLSLNVSLAADRDGMVLQNFCAKY